MPTWLKVLLIIGGLIVVLIIVTVVATFVVVKRYGPQLVEMGKQTIEEGQEYGRRPEQQCTQIFQQVQQFCEQPPRHADGVDNSNAADAPPPPPPAPAPRQTPNTR